MQIHRTSVEVAVHTPAKLNLFFEVLGRRTDGYHEIESLMCPIALFDTIQFVASEKEELQFECRWAAGGGRSTTSAGAARASGFSDVPLGAENLVVRAMEVVRRATGERRGAAVRLTKRIPSAAGLGGGSSDAAATLVAANLGWNLGLSESDLTVLAAQLGSDVPFFLANSPAITRGRGEIIEPLDSLGPLHFVIVRPADGLATATVYHNCSVSGERRNHAGRTHAGQRIDAIVAALRSGDLRSAGRLFFNRLQEAAEKLSASIARLHDLFARETCFGHAMSGSGTSYFGLVANVKQARRLAQKFRATGVGIAVYASSCGGQFNRFGAIGSC